MSAERELLRKMIAAWDSGAGMYDTFHDAVEQGRALLAQSTEGCCEFELRVRIMVANGATAGRARYHGQHVHLGLRPGALSALKSALQKKDKTSLAEEGGS